MDITHRIIITKEALADLAAIAQYIRINSPQNAATVAETILSAIDSLSIMPTRFKISGKSQKPGSPIHAMVIRPFILYYRVDDGPKLVFILNVVHGARRQPIRFD